MIRDVFAILSVFVTFTLVYAAVGTVFGWGLLVNLPWVDSIMIGYLIVNLSLLVDLIGTIKAFANSLKLAYNYFTK